MGERKMNMKSVSTLKEEAGAWHANEAFSSLRIEDYKNFLRLHIAKDGSLTIFPIGIERVPRRWRATEASAFDAQLEPDDPSARKPQLIEPPLVTRWSRSPAPESHGE